MPTASDLVTDLPADFEVFGQAVDTSLADLKGGTTDQVLAKNSNTDMDFKWVTSDDANAIQNSIVDAKGDLIAASANDTPARLAVGANGETLVADSSTSTGLRYQAIQTRNCIYNSSYEVWQRGTSFTAAGYAADRWYASTGGAAGRTISRIAGTGQFQYLTRVQRTAGNTATNGVDYGQPLEIADCTPYAGKTVTLSFYARKGADFSGTLTAYVFSGTSSTEANRVVTAYASGGATPLNQTVSLTTTLTRYQYTFTFGASVTQFCVVLSCGFTGTAGAADSFDVTGVQLEVGSVATDYVRQGATIQGELAACQRYYVRWGGLNTYQNFGQGYADQTTTAIIQVPLPVTMRVVPTSIDFSTLNLTTGGTNTTVTNCTLLGGNSSNQIACAYATVASGLTTNRPYGLTANNSFGGYIGFSAEL